MLFGLGASYLLDAGPLGRRLNLSSMASKSSVRVCLPPSGRPPSNNRVRSSAAGVIRGTFGRSRVISASCAGDNVREMTVYYKEMNRYFEMINRRVPDRVSGFVHWLRKPSSKAARLTVALLLILGGVFSFLPVLGIWMLPLGLLFIAQDVPFLQRPVVRALGWSETTWKRLRLQWQNR